jgi:YggT family protein
MTAFITLLSYALYAFLIILLIRVAFSWISPFPTNLISRFAYQVTEPVLAPIRRMIPPVSGIDLSPLVVTVAVYFVIAALRNLG